MNCGKLEAILWVQYSIPECSFLGAFSWRDYEDWVCDEIWDNSFISFVIWDPYRYTLFSDVSRNYYILLLIWATRFCRKEILHPLLWSSMTWPSMLLNFFWLMNREAAGKLHVKNMFGLSNGLAFEVLSTCANCQQQAFIKFGACKAQSIPALILFGVWQCIMTAW